MATEVLHQYEDEIESLEAEICALTQQCEDSQLFRLTDASVRAALGTLDAPLAKPANAADLELQHLEGDLTYLKELSGIGFTEFSKKMLKRAENKATYKYRLAGKCCALPFQLEFQLLDVQEQESVSSAVTELCITMDSGECSDLSKFVSSVEKRKSLLLFFRTLSAFSEWCEYRKRIFARFRESYADLVRLPEGSSAEQMVVRSPKLSGCELIIVWKIGVSEDGAVTPVLDLLTKVPEQALGLDKKKIIERAPGNFRTLLKVYGIEATMEQLIKSFAMLD